MLGVFNCQVWWSRYMCRWTMRRSINLQRSTALPPGTGSAPRRGPRCWWSLWLRRRKCFCCWLSLFDCLWLTCAKGRGGWQSHHLACAGQGGRQLEEGRPNLHQVKCWSWCQCLFVCHRGRTPFSILMTQGPDTGGRHNRRRWPEEEVLLTNRHQKIHWKYLNFSFLTKSTKKRILSASFQWKYVFTNFCACLWKWKLN